MKHDAKFWLDGLLVRKVVQNPAMDEMPEEERLARISTRRDVLSSAKSVNSPMRVTARDNVDKRDEPEPTKQLAQMWMDIWRF